MMNRRRLSFLAAAPLLLAAGCAMTADQPAPEVEEPIAVAQQKDVPSSPADVLEQLGEGALNAAASAAFGDSIGGAVVGLFLPPGGSGDSDTSGLIGSLSAVIDATAMGYLLADYQAKVDAAASEINALKWGWVSEPDGTDTADQYVDVNTTQQDALSAALHLVSGSLQPNPGATAAQISASNALQQNGFYFYLATAQLDISRLQLLMTIDQANVARATTTAAATAAASNLVTHRNRAMANLGTYITYVRQQITARANGAVRGALLGISACQDVSSDFENTTSYAAFEAGGTMLGMSQASNLDVALARCDEHRDQYVDQQRRAAQATANSTYRLAAQMVDLWARTLDTWNAEISAADRSAVNGIIAQTPAFVTAGKTTRALPLDFGGMWGQGSQGTWYDDPLTGTTSCPSGFASNAFLGTGGVDYPANACTQVLNLQENPTLDFGGMYGEMDGWEPDGKVWPNPITQAASCPSGYTATQVLGADVDHRLFYCSRPHVAGRPSQYLFGGVFSYAADDGNYRSLYPNSVTSDATCPVGYTPTIVLGSTGARGTVTDERVAFCYQTTDVSDPAPPTVAAWDFGGAFGYVGGGAVGGTSCPSGYTATQVLNTGYVDWPVSFCARPHQEGVDPLYDFGGMWGNVNGVQKPNPITGAASCPAGYTDLEVLGSANCDPYPLHVCYAPHAAGTMPVHGFGGMYGEVSYAFNANPVTGEASCPAGYTNTQVLGTNGIDEPLHFCWN